MSTEKISRIESPEQGAKFGSRAMSLPKIPSRVKLSQLQVLDKQGANSRAALTFKHLSDMDHQHLVAIRGYIKQDIRKRSHVVETAKYDSKADLRASFSNP